MPMTTPHITTPHTKLQKTLIIMAHGSRKEAANQEFITLVEAMKNNPLDYHRIEHCFLEIASPNLQTTVENLLNEGQTQFDLYPLFFNQGNHVSRDIPKQIQHIQERYPNCHIKQLSYFGQYQQLQETIGQHINEQNGAR